MKRSIPVAWLMMILGLLAGCPPEVVVPPHPPLVMPGDFALTIHVQNANATATDPYTQTSQNVLEADRKLRAAVGPGAGMDYFPPVTRTISPEQMEEVYRLAQQVRWQASQATAKALEGAVVYTMSLRAGGWTHNLVTTSDNQPAQALLRRLIDLRSPLELAKPATTTQPETR